MVQVKSLICCVRVREVWEAPTSEVHDVRGGGGEWAIFRGHVSSKCKAALQVQMQMHSGLPACPGNIWRDRGHGSEGDMDRQKHFI